MTFDRNVEIFSILQNRVCFF